MAQRTDSSVTPRGVAREDTLSAKLVCNNDWDHIYQGLYQGGAPSLADDRDIQEPVEVDVVVLCAREYQPHRMFLGNVERYRIPYRDTFDPGETSPEDLERAIKMGEVVAGLISHEHKRVLVTCWMGWNRSGLVSTIALLNLRPSWTAKDAIQWLQMHRYGAMGNPLFCDLVESYDRIRRDRASGKRSK